MKATELKFLILKELADFHEIRPSSDSWCSIASILKKLGINDMEFARSVLQSLIEENLINHRGGSKSDDGLFELVIQANKNGLSVAAQHEAERKINEKSPNSKLYGHENNVWQRPIGLIWIATAAGILVLMVGFIFRHHFGIPL